MNNEELFIDNNGYLSEFTDLLDPNFNYTRNYLFDTRYNHYERIATLIIKTVTKQKNQTETDDTVREYMLDLIRKDKFKKHLSKNKPIKDSVCIHWFYQYLDMITQKWGKDAHLKTLTGAKSQNEIKLDKEYVLSSNDLCSVVVNDNEDESKSYDYFDEQQKNEAENNLFAEQVNKIIYKKMFAKFGEEKGKYMFRLYETDKNETFKNRMKWAEAWDVSYSKLTADINVYKETIREIGQDAFCL